MVETIGVHNFSFLAHSSKELERGNKFTLLLPKINCQKHPALDRLKN